MNSEYADNFGYRTKNYFKQNQITKTHLRMYNKNTNQDIDFGMLKDKVKQMEQIYDLNNNL